MKRGLLVENIAEALRLPWYVDKDLALKRIVDEGKKDLPLVADVLAGRTTFERAVEPIVKESFRTRNPYAVCRSEAFRKDAARIQEQMKNVLYMSDWLTTKNSRVAPLVVFLILASIPSLMVCGLSWLGTGSFMGMFQPWVTPWLLFRWLGLGGILLATLMTLPGELQIMGRQRRIAEELKHDARYLDGVFAKIRRGESFANDSSHDNN